VTAHINLGDALNRKGDLDGAAGACREVIRLDPKFAPGHNNLGLVLRAMGDLDGALACFREAARLDPNEPKVHYNLASTLRNKGDVTASIRSYSEALRLVLAQGKDDSALRTNGGLGKTVASLEEVVRLDPDDANAHNDLAWALATGPDGVRDGKRAVEHATRACELTVWKEPSYIDTLGAAHAEAGDFIKAVEYQNKALSFAPFEAANGKGGRMRLELYAQKKPFRDPAQATRESAPPPRNAKRP
jgi:tetratricopeptide (TPR) repeat protein